MKLKLALAAVTLLTSAVGFSDPVRLINLKVKAASQEIRVDYPGPISGICGFRVETTHDLTLSDVQLADLSKSILLSDGFLDEGVALAAQLSEWDLRWDMASIGTFFTTLHIKSANGKSLISNVERITGKNNAAVLLVPNDCDK